MLDINLYPLNIKNSSEQSFLPGLRFLAAPKNANRNRQGDQLILMASPAGEKELAEDRLQVMLGNVMDDYFQSSGTVTRGLQHLAESLNEKILDYNLKENPAGKPLTLNLVCVVVHGERVYLAHIGRAHSFLLNKNDTRHFHDPETENAALGGSRAPGVRFFLGDIGQDEYMVHTPEPMPSWTPTSPGDSQAFTLDFLKRRLLNQVSPNVRALLVQFRQGTGRIILQPALSSNTAFVSERSAPPQAPYTVKGVPRMAVPNPELKLHPAVDKPQAPEGSAPARPALTVNRLNSSQDLNSRGKNPTAARGSSQQDELSYREALGELSQDITKVFRKAKAGINAVTGNTKVEKPPRHPAAEIRFKKPDTSGIEKAAVSTSSAAGKAAGFAGKALTSLWKLLLSGTRKLVSRIAPKDGIRLPNLSNGAMVLIAFAIPLLVVVIAASMYLNRGKTSQFDFYLNQAQTAATQTAGISDPANLRSAWENVIVLLDKAAKYGDSKDAGTLRSQAQNVLDDLAGIARVEFMPAIVDGLPGSVNIVQIAASTTDIYMLDSNSGQVLRAILTGKGFEMDPTFNCSPGPYGSYVVDPFVDMAILPKGNAINASVAAVDPRGNIVYCGAGIMSTSMTLIPPDAGWGSIRGLTIDSTRLYILDTGNNSLLVYDGGIGAYINKPYSYFEKNSTGLQDILDFAVNGNDLYLLHQDGHMTNCNYSEVYGTDTKCKDPVPYAVTINGVEKKPVIVPETSFMQLQYSQPPDPSIYLLDASGHSLYHFSLRMTLQKKVSMQSGDPYRLGDTPATAFAVNPGKIMFIAFGNKIFKGIEP